MLVQAVIPEPGELGLQDYHWLYSEFKASLQAPKPNTPNLCQNENQPNIDHLKKKNNNKKKGLVDMFMHLFMSVY